MDDEQLHFSSEPERSGFEALLAQYVAEIPARAQELLDAAQAQDLGRISAMLHQLAGSLGLYGYRRLEGQCRANLARLRQGESLDAIRPELERLHEELSRVRARPAL